MTRYPGYTLSGLAREDYAALHLHLALLDPDLGKADDSDAIRE